MPQHILVVEDEKEIASLLEDYLNTFGYQTACLHHGNEVIPYVEKHHPDLILLDVMLPGKDGIEICREIRNSSNVPIIMVTARIEEVDRLLGLELGADDYVCKPFSPREVMARVKSVLRRVQPAPAGNSEQLLAGPIRMNTATYQVVIHQTKLSLTPSEFGLLKAMVEQPERVFSRNDLLNKVQGYDFDGYDRTIDTHIKNLRKKIALALPNQDIIVSVYGIGYQLMIPSA
ncbi:MAG: response regulator [SAR324 cluster bacterium]|nr:response regulator [SAR324 cluster bacterium]